MKVTLINKSDSGGGAAAAGHRLFSALRASGADVCSLVQVKNTNDPGVSPVVKSAADRAIAQVDFLYERLPFILKERDPSVRFAFSTAVSGRSVADHPDVKDADILHLHWTNGGFLSDKNLAALFKLGKPVVWTLHDMWPFTGGCHYTGGCDHFLQSCGNCPFLAQPRPGDISRRGWTRKKDLYRLPSRIAFVGCSNWMKEMAGKSSLLNGRMIRSIPNPIDTQVFAPADKAIARRLWNIGDDEQLILFGAANVQDKRKGIGYLVLALEKLRETMSESGRKVRIILFGKNRSFELSALPFPAIALPKINSEETLAMLYSAADVFVLPSIEDNLPNMVMESLSCGTPVVAFRTGGLPDLVEHKINGYLAEFLSAEDLAAGIDWALSARPPAETVRAKVLNDFAYPVVARAYRQLYGELIHG